ncbi:MAG: ankyrin repeat domain-containing protein [Bacteroidota bacterium]
MKHVHLPYICKIALVVAMITDCSQLTMHDATLAGVPSPMGSGEGATGHISATDIATTDQHGINPDLSQILSFPILRLRGGVSTEGNLDHGERQEDESFFEEFVFLVDDPETSLEEIKSLLSDNKYRVQRSYSPLVDDFEYTVLHYLAKKNETELVKYLVEDMHMDPDIHNGELKITALQFAALRGHLRTVKYLMDRGASLAHQDSQNNSVMLYAVTGGHLNVVEYLMEVGADMSPEANTEYKGLNLLHMAIIHNGAHYVDRLIDLMQSKGVNVTAMAKQCTDLADRATPLSLADQVYGKNSQVSNKLRAIVGASEVEIETNPTKKLKLGDGQT